MVTSDDYYKLLVEVGVDTKRLSVVLYALEHADPETNIFHGSYDTIARETGVSYSTVVKTLKAMMSSKYIEQVKNGVWRITDTRIFEAKETNYDDSLYGIPIYIRSYAKPTE